MGEITESGFGLKSVKHRGGSCRKRLWAERGKKRGGQIAESGFGLKSVMWRWEKVTESGFGLESVMGGEGKEKGGLRAPFCGFMCGGD